MAINRIKIKVDTVASETDLKIINSIKVGLS